MKVVSFKGQYDACLPGSTAQTKGNAPSLTTSVLDALFSSVFGNCWADKSIAFCALLP